MRAPSALLGAAEQIDDAALGLELVEQQAHALEILDRLEVLEQMRGAAHDQLALVALAARPAREPGRDDLLGERVELRLLRFERLLQLDLRFQRGCGRAHAR